MCDKMSEEKMIVKLLQILDYNTDCIESCQFAQHSDFVLATTSKDRSFRVFEWKQGVGFKEREWSPIIDSVKNVYWSPLGAFLVTNSSSHKATLWNSQTGEIIHNFTHTRGCTISACAFSPPPMTILATAGYDGSICFWNFITFCSIRYWAAHDDAISCCIFTNDGKYFLTSSRSGIKVWQVCKCLDCELRTTELREYRFADYAGVVTFAIHTLKMNKYNECYPGGSTAGGLQSIIEVDYYVAAGSENNEVTLWQLNATEKFAKVEQKLCYKTRLLKRFFGHKSTVTCVKFNHSGTMIASVSLDKTLRLWEMSNFTCRVAAIVHKQFVTDCSFSKDDTFLVTGSYDCKVKIWDVSGKLITLYTPLADDESTMKKTNEELEKCIRVDDQKINIFQKLPPSGNAINTINFSKDMTLAVGGSDKIVSIWKYDGVMFAEIQKSPLYYHKIAIQALEFSRCGRWLATCSHDGTCVLWDTVTWESVNSFFLHSANGFTALRFSPDSRMIATASMGESCDVWNIIENRHLMHISGYEDTVTCVSFSSDGEIVASGSSTGDIKLFSLGVFSRNIVKTIHSAHDLGVTSCDFANSRKNFYPLYTLATCGKNDQIYLWTVSPTWHTEHVEIKVKLRLVGHGGICTCVRFAPCDTILASTSGDKTCRLWSVITGHCLYVLDDHLSIATCCAFSDDCRFLATSSMDRTVIIYELPELSQFKDFIVRGHEESFLSTHDHRNINVDIPEPGLFPTDQTSHSNSRVQLQVGHFVPDEMLCPICCTLMTDPVKCSDGFTYERSAIQTWFSQHDSATEIRSPMTNLPLTSLALVTDTYLESMIRRFINENRTESTAQAVASNTDEASAAATATIFDDVDKVLDQMKLN